MSSNFIPGETYISVSGNEITDDDIAMIVKCASKKWVTEGEFTHEFTEQLRKSFEPVVRHAIPCNSGSSASLLAVSAITQPEFGNGALRPGDEVVTTAVGFPTTLSAIVQNGLVPVFVDVDFPTYNARPEVVDEAIDRMTRTKAVFLPHTMGNPFELQVMRDMIDENGIWMLSDACDALGADVDGVTVGSLEDITTLSFFPAHHISAGEGGAVLTCYPMVAKVVNSLRAWGRACWCLPGENAKCGNRFGQKCGMLPEGYDHKYTFSRMGYNMQWTDLQAALALSQLGRLSSFVEKRRSNHAKLYAGLQHLSDYFILPEPTKGSNPSWFGFVLTLQKHVPFTRRELIDYLEAHRIATRPLMGSNLLHQPAFKHIKYRISGKLINSDAISTDTFWIGVHPGITDEMIDYMIEIINTFVKIRSHK